MSKNKDQKNEADNKNKFCKLVGNDKVSTRDFEIVEARKKRTDEKRQKHNAKVNKIEDEIEVLKQKIRRKEDKIWELEHDYREKNYTPTDVNYFRYMKKYNATQIRATKKSGETNYIIELKIDGEWFFISFDGDNYRNEKLIPSSQLTFLDYEED